MRTVWQDLRIAIRTVGRRPGFALLAVGTLGLGIGAHSTLVSIVDDVLLTPLDLPRSDELVVARMQESGEYLNFTGPNAIDLIDGTSDAFASAAAFWGASATIESPDGTREVRAGVGATPGVFDTLGVRMQIGQAWGAEAVGTGSVAAVVISDRLWRSRFGADPAAIGSALLLSGASTQITGVLPPDFAFPTLESADFFFPPVSDPATLSRAGLGAFTVIARRRPHVSSESARAAVARAWEALRAEHPGDLRDYGVMVMGLQDYMVRDARPALLALLGATSLLLILACANVANLQLARGIGRNAEMSIRAALGAGRGRLVRQLLVESAALSATAALAGIGLAEGALRVIRAVAPPEIPGIDEVGLSLRAVGFVLPVAVGCAVLVGLLPAMRASHAALSGALRDGTRSTDGPRLRRVQGALVVAQVAATLVIAIAAGLLIRSYATLSGVDPGYRTEGVLTATIAVPFNLYPDRAARAAFFDRLEAEVESLPGVQRVGTTLRAPFVTGELSVPVRLADSPEMTMADAPRVELGIVSPGYLDALAIPVLRGRNFTDEDRAQAPRAVLLSESLARSLYGGDNPVGRRLTPVLGPWDAATTWAEVVGVVGDIRLKSLDAAAVGMLYLATAQMPQTSGTLIVQTAGDASALAGSVRAALFRAEPELLAPTLRTMEDLRADSLARPRFNSIILGTFSFLALALSVVGIYGLLSYSVERRRHELGVRVALGASRGAVLRLVLAEGMRLAGIGLLIGLGGAFIASRAVSSLLFGLTPTDPATYVGTSAGVAALALASCLVPALRAAGGDPREVLRGD